MCYTNTETIIVRADWDADAKVWVASIDDDILGLATEAATLEELRAKVLAMIDELALSDFGAPFRLARIEDIGAHEA